MKNIQQLSAIIIIIFLSGCSVKSQNNMTTNHQMIEENNASDKIMKSQTIKLKKGELFLVISSVTKPNAQNLMNEYFEKVFPIAQKNGFKPLSSLPIDKIVAGDYQPNNFVGLYSWASISSVESFLKELPNAELKPMRMKIWEELKQSVGNVTEDFEFTLKEGKTYELQTLWAEASKERENDLSLVKKYDGKIILDFPVISYEDLTNGTPPTQMVLIEWDSSKDADKYRMKKKSSGNEESFYTHLKIPAK